MNRLGADIKERHLKKNNTVGSYMLDMIIMLIWPVLMSWYYYGERALKMVVFSVLAAVLTEWAGCYIICRRRSLRDLSSLVTGIIIALLMPASAPYWIAAVGSVFAVLVAKLPFGSAKNAPFVPAAAGYAFLSICWPKTIYSYPAVGGGIVSSISENSIASMLKSGNSINDSTVNFLDVFLGNAAGPMGATCIVVLFGVMIYFLIRRPSMWLSTAGFVGICAVSAVLFPRVMTGRTVSLVMELCSGSLLFTALFILPDISLLPETPLQRLCYGMGAGALCMLIRWFGPFEEGACFAVLIMNAVWPAVHGAFAKKEKKEKKRKKQIAVKGEGALSDE